MRRDQIKPRPTPAAPMSQPATVGKAAAPVNCEMLELGRGAEAVPSEGALEGVVERLGVTGGNDDAITGGGEGGATDDCWGDEEGAGGGDTREAESARLLSGGALLGDGGGALEGGGT
tara:strand:- start:2188 stop:2541 length:354 start_codon:yes stop_codon:yes gene_type:complete